MLPKFRVSTHPGRFLKKCRNWLQAELQYGNRICMRESAINPDRQEQDKKYKLILPYDLTFLKTNLKLQLS